MKNRGLGNDDCNFWCRLKKNVKRNVRKLVAAVLTFNPGVIAVAVGTVVGDSINWGFINFRGALPSQDVTDQEAAILENWNNNNFIPFVQKIEELLTGNNTQKNTALTLIQVYIQALRNEIIEDGVPGLSVDAQQMRLAFVIDVLSDLTSTLSDPPLVLTQVNVDNSIKALMKEVQGDLRFIPSSVEVNLYEANTKPVDINLNLTKSTKAEVIAQNLVVQNPANTPVDAIIDGVPPQNLTPNNKWLGKLLKVVGISGLCYGVIKMFSKNKSK